MTICDDTYLYFFSAYAQSIAALVAFSGAFIVFKLQSNREYLFEKAAKVYAAFNKGGRYGPFLTDEQERKFVDCVSHLQRLRFVEPIYYHYLNEDPNKTSEILKGRVRDSELMRAIGEFKGFKEEFIDFHSVQNNSEKIRQRFIRSSAYGFLIFFFGMFAIVLKDAEYLNSSRPIIILIFLIALLVLGFSLFSIIQLTIRD